jgi:hypothetical protein
MFGVSGVRIPEMANIYLILMDIWANLGRSECCPCRADGCDGGRCRSVAVTARDVYGLTRPARSSSARSRPVLVGGRAQLTRMPTSGAGNSLCRERGGYGIRAVAPGASAEAARQSRGRADDGAGGRTGQGLPRPDEARRGADKGRQHAGLGNQRGVVPGRRPLLLQVRRLRPP